MKQFSFQFFPVLSYQKIKIFILVSNLSVIYLFSEWRINIAEKNRQFSKGGLTQFWELFTVIPCATKDFKR